MGVNRKRERFWVPVAVVALGGPVGMLAVALWQHGVLGVVLP